MVWLRGFRDPHGVLDVFISTSLGKCEMPDEYAMGCRSMTTAISQDTAISQGKLENWISSDPAAVIFRGTLWLTNPLYGMSAIAFALDIACVLSVSVVPICLVGQWVWVLHVVCHTFSGAAKSSHCVWTQSRKQHRATRSLLPL